MVSTAPPPPPPLSVTSCLMGPTQPPRPQSRSQGSVTYSCHHHRAAAAVTAQRSADHMLDEALDPCKGSLYISMYGVHMEGPGSAG